MCMSTRFVLRACDAVIVAVIVSIAVPHAVRAAPAVAVRMGEADVRASAGGVPCFTIAEREERLNGAPSFHAISVSAATGKARAPMWQMTMPAERTFPLLFSMCVPYAGRVPSLPQQHAEALEAGRVYEVSIEVRAGAAPAHPRFYGARFCLARQADGSSAVRLLGGAGRNSCAPR